MVQQRHVSLAIGLTLLLGRVTWAGGLGIALDGFLVTFLNFVIGLGVIIFILGLGSYVYQWVRHEAW